MDNGESLPHTKWERKTPAHARLGVPRRTAVCGQSPALPRRGGAMRRIGCLAQPPSIGTTRAFPRP